MRGAGRQMRGAGRLLPVLAIAVAAVCAVAILGTAGSSLGYDYAAYVQAGQRIQFRPSVPFDDGVLASLPDVTSVIHRGDVVVVTGNSNALNAVTSALARNQIVARQLRVDQANLEDAFLALTGRPAPERQGA